MLENTNEREVADVLRQGRMRSVKPMGNVRLENLDRNFKIRDREGLEFAPGEGGPAEVRVGRENEVISNKEEETDVVARLKQGVRDNSEKEERQRRLDLKAEAKDSPLGGLKTRLLNLIPGYGPFAAFTRFMKGKKIGFDIFDIVIASFSNLTALFVVLAVLAGLVLIVDFIQADWTDKAGAIVGGLTKIGWAGIEVLIKLFSS